MVLLNGVECTITTASGPLPEYPAPRAPGSFPDAVVYVAAAEGAEFTLTVHIREGTELAGADCLSYTAFVDGQRIPEGVLAFPGKPSVYAGSRSRTADGSWVQRKFKFADVDAADDGAEPPREVVVRLRRYEITGLMDKKEVSATYGKADAEKQSARKSEAIKAPNVSAGNFLDPEVEPYALFKFRYRSEKTLRRLGLIPEDNVGAAVEQDRIVRRESSKRERAESFTSSVQANAPSEEKRQKMEEDTVGDSAV